MTVYLIPNDHKTGLAYVERAPAEADRETIIRIFLSGVIFKRAPRRRRARGRATAHDDT